MIDDSDKLCCTCRRVQPRTEFNVRRAARDGLQDRCRDCSRAWYQANKTAHKRNVRKNTVIALNRLRRELGAYLATHPCTDCGESDIRVLEFDHVGDDKSFDIAHMVNGLYSWERILEEIAKCEVRCSNCHRIVTLERCGAWRSAAQRELAEASAAAAAARLERILLAGV